MNLMACEDIGGMVEFAAIAFSKKQMHSIIYYKWLVLAFGCSGSFTHLYGMKIDKKLTPLDHLPNLSC